MAEDQSDTNSGNEDKPWWREILSDLPPWTKWGTGLAVVGALLMAAYSTNNGERLMNVLAGPVRRKLWKMTKGLFLRLELAIYLLANLTFIFDGFILLEFGRQSLQLGSWSWANSIENRMIGGLPVMILLQFLLFLPVTRLAKWLVAAGIAEGYLSESGIGDSIVTRYVRTIAKLNAWHAAGFVLAVWPTYWKWPATLAFSAAMVPVWPYFTNAWKSGESEHLRRAILTGMGVATLDAALLAASASITKTPLMGLFAGQFNIGGLLIVLLFGLEAWFVWTSSTRKTPKDVAWEAKEVESIHLEQLTERKRAVDSGRVDPASLSLLSPVVTNTSQQVSVPAASTGYLYPSERLGSRYSSPARFPAKVGWVTMICLGILGILWVINAFAPWIFTVNTAIHP